MAYTYASNLNGTYETILESVQQIFSADADLFTGFSSNPSYLFADNLRQTMHNYAEFLEGALWLYGAVIVGNDLSEIEAVSLPLSTQDANYLSTRTNGFDTAINYLTTNLKMQPAPLANLTTSGPLIGDPGFETYFSQLNAEVAPSNLLSVQEGTLTDFANAPLSGATLTWVSPNFGTLPFGTGNGIAQVFQLPPEFTFPSIVPVAGVYKSDWQGNQLQYATPRTNYLPNTISMSGFAGVSSPLPTITTGQADPNGGTNAVLFTAAAASYGGIFRTTSVDASFLSLTNINSSVFVKAGTAQYVGLRNHELNHGNGTGTPSYNVVNLSTLAVNNSINPGDTLYAESVPGGWIRLWLSSTIRPTGDVNLYDVAIVDASGSTFAADVGGQTLYIFAPNACGGSVAGSYIPTTTAPVTVTDYSLSGSTLTFSIAPISNSSLTWQDASSNIFNFGVGNGSTTVYNLGVEYNPGPSIYKSDWQGNQLQYSTPRTNLISAGQGINLSGWIALNGTIGAVGVDKPDGSNALYQFTATSAGGNRASIYGSLVSGTTYTLSAWLNGYSGGNYFGLVVGDGINNLCGAIFFIGSGTVISTINTSSATNVTATAKQFTQGTRCTLTFTSLITASVGMGFGISDGSTYAAGIFPSGASGTMQGGYVQLEVGSNATSFIPTTIAPVTVTDYSLKSSLGVYGVSQDETNGWSRIRTALLLSGASYPPNLADTLTFMQNIQQKVTNYGVTYAPTLSNNFPVSAIWNYAICVWTYQDMAAIYSNLPDSQVIQNIQILRYVLKQVELQCAELLTAYRTQAQIPPNTSPLLQSDSLMDLANRALGDYTQWVNIATANGLLPPYTYPTPAPNIASPGTQLFMPGSSTPTNLGNYLLNFLGTDLNWGIPLQSMPVWTGDFETVVGYTNLRWALARRILTPLNSLIYHPEYGSYLSQYLGQPLTNLNLQLILSYTSIALLNDPRIASIVNLTPALTEVNTLLIQASVQPLGIGVTPTQINLTLQPSAISVT